MYSAGIGGQPAECKKEKELHAEDDDQYEFRIVVHTSIAANAVAVVARPAVESARMGLTCSVARP